VYRLRRYAEHRSHELFVYRLQHYIEDRSHEVFVYRLQRYAEHRSHELFVYRLQHYIEDRSHEVFVYRLQHYAEDRSHELFVCRLQKKNTHRIVVMKRWWETTECVSGEMSPCNTGIELDFFAGGATWNIINEVYSALEATD
jgi:hypothetical protein